MNNEIEYLFGGFYRLLVKFNFVNIRNKYCFRCLMYNEIWGCWWIYRDDKGLLKIGDFDYMELIK